MRRTLALILLCLVPACGGHDGPEIWIYTSIYPHVIDQMTPALEKEFPGVRFEWFQKGSEVVGARLNMELAAGRTECDLLLTSDPFHYAELKAAGRLIAHQTEATRAVPAELKDPDHHFATVRIPLMVLAVNNALSTLR